MVRHMLIGIDLGTTVLKVIAVDSRTGALHAEISRRLPITTDAQGRREQDLAMLDAAFADVFATLRKKTGEAWRNIKGIGLSAQGGSTIIADRSSGRPLTPMILWNDARAFSQLDILASRKPPQWWREYSLRDEPGMGLARIQWLRQHDARLMEEGNIYIGAGEYLYFQLTGQWRQDACNALQTGCYDARSQTLTERPLSLVDLSLEFFAPMRKGHETFALKAEAARRLGLPEGTPVAGPYNDHEAGYLAAEGHAGRPMQVSLGTAWVGNFVLPSEQTGDSPTQLVVPGPDGDTRQVIQPLLTGNVTWDWALATFLDADHGRALEQQKAVFEEDLLPSEGLLALPWLNRPNPICSKAHGAAALYGIGPATGRCDMLRAFAASMAFELERVFKPLVDNKIIDRLILSGGASKGWVFQQLIAALFDPLPVYRFDREELVGARGCLAAFGSAAQDIPIEKIASVADAGKISAQAKLYRELFSNAYGNVPSGRAYQPQKTGRAGTE